MSRRAGLALAMLMVLPGCTGSPQLPQPSPGATTEGHTETAQPTAAQPSQSPTSAARGTREVTAFFLRDQGGRLWVEPAMVALDQPTRAVAHAAVSALLRGQPGVPGLFSPVNPATRVRGASLRDRVLTVDVSSDVRQPAGGAATEAAFAQQLAHAATQFDGIDAVRLWVDGKPVTQLWGHLDWSQPVRPDVLALAPVVITGPRWGVTVPAGAVTVRGEANTFEATVGLRLIAPDGRVAEEAFTTATCGSGCRGTWSHPFRFPAPGRWTVEASEDDPSAGEGRQPFTARLEIHVR